MSVRSSPSHHPVTLGEATLVRRTASTPLASATPAGEGRVEPQAVLLGRGLNPVAVADRIRSELGHNGLDELLVESKRGDLFLVYGTDLSGQPAAGDTFVSDRVKGRVLMAAAEPRYDGQLGKVAAALFFGGAALSVGLGVLFPAIEALLLPGAAASGLGVALGAIHGLSTRPGADLSSILGFADRVA